MTNQNPTMSRKQAIMLWNSLTPQQRFQFNDMLAQLKNGDLMLKEINMTAKEELQSIVLEPKEKPSKPIEPFMQHFDTKRKIDIVVEAVKNESNN